MQVEALNSDVSRRYRDENVNFYYSRTLRFFLSVKNNNVKCLICVLFNLLKMINVSAWSVIANFEKRKKYHRKDWEIFLQYQNHGLMWNQSMISTATWLIYEQMKNEE